MAPDRIRPQRFRLEPRLSLAIAVCMLGCATQSHLAVQSHRATQGGPAAETSQAHGASSEGAVIAERSDRPKGTVVGEIGHYEFPDWFATSFLNLPEDVEEARQEGRHVLVYFHMDHCPACARLVTKDFATDSTSRLLKEHFSVVVINIHGSREVVWIDGKTYTERELTDVVDVFATPGLVFLSQKGEAVLKFIGYRDRRSLEQALQFVRTRAYESQTLVQYAATHPVGARYAFRDEPLFTDGRDLAGYTKPLAVVFEDERCVACDAFHDKTLSRSEVREEMKQLRWVRYDADSDETIVGIDGKETTPKKWATQLGLTYRPAVMLFHEGKLVLRMDGLVYPYGFKENLRFVSGGHYKRYPSRRAYNAARRKELLDAGETIDVGHDAAEATP